MPGSAPPSHTIYPRSLLASVERPARYTGGEFGTIRQRPGNDDLKVCIIFPDLYEIGMSNQAVRILYAIVNRQDGLHAERAFCPATDFSDALRSSGIRLKSLETGRPLSDFDILAFTIGYELAFTNVLNILDLSGIPLLRMNREEHHPLVIAGGPAITNPLPWSDYIDGVYIGEAEERFVDDLLVLRELRRSSTLRSTSVEALETFDEFWTTPNRTAHRAVWGGFTRSADPVPALPVPSMIPVMDHGVVEIMRGCPNRCRFCHAGIFYRPYRQKSFDRIRQETDELVRGCGYRKITLSSLSTGDYPDIDRVVELLNKLYASRHVSFSLPSLRVSSVTLRLIGSLNSVRKSGLTFAVETPTVSGQRGINKEVPAEHVLDILEKARSEGWRQAKFYFMLGLPVDQGESETGSIVTYLLDVQKRSRMNLSVNIGTFIPKPHTPFERSPQLTEHQALNRISEIRSGLAGNRRIKISYTSPFISFLEGIFSRGDRRAGVLALDAWRLGAGFDAWNDRMNEEAWRRAIQTADWDVEGEICRGFSADAVLPWHSIDLGVSSRHLSQEAGKASNGELTDPCGPECTRPCGVCSPLRRVERADRSSEIEMVPAGFPPDTPPDVEPPRLSDLPAPLPADRQLPPLSQVPSPKARRLLILFSKFGPAVYLGHLDVLSVIEKTMLRSGFQIDFTRGFNPKPRIEFAQPLTLGVQSEEEVCSIGMLGLEDGIDQIVRRISDVLPAGFSINRACWIPDTAAGRKKTTLMGTYWGSDWRLEYCPEDGVPDDSRIASNHQFTDPVVLAEAIRSECRGRGINNGCHIRVDGDSVRLRLKGGGTRDYNLMSLLEAVFGRSPLTTDWLIIREHTLAAGPGNLPISYLARMSHQIPDPSAFTDSQ